MLGQEQVDVGCSIRSPVGKICCSQRLEAVEGYTRLTESSHVEKLKDETALSLSAIANVAFVRVEMKISGMMSLSWYRDIDIAKTRPLERCMLITLQ